MNESLITTRYVKALYELAAEVNSIKEVLSDINLLYSIITESREFHEFLDSPIIKPSKKVKMMDQLFSKELSSISMQFLYLLIANNRESYLKSVCIHFISYYKRHQGIREGVITTAIPLDKKHREEVHSFVSKKFKMKVDLTEKIDPDIIGGFILRIEDQQINASIATQLNRIKRELIQS